MKRSTNVKTTLVSDDEGYESQDFSTTKKYKPTNVGHTFHLAKSFKNKSGFMPYLTFPDDEEAEKLRCQEAENGEATLSLNNPEDSASKLEVKQDDGKNRKKV